MKPFSLRLLPLLAFATACLATPPPPAVLRAATVTTPPPAATLADFTWLVGSWSGPLDGHAQEAHTFPAAAGQQPGFARAWTADGQLLFSEINQLVEVDGTVEFRVKHFGADFHGWEARDDYARHRLLAREGDTWFFDGITLRHDGPDQHTVAVRVTAPDGSESITVVTQQRSNPSAPPLHAGRIEPLAFNSAILAEARNGLNPQRDLRIYLPPSYDHDPARRYPVVYFCHSLNWSARQMFEDGVVQRHLERAFAAGTAPEFILVGTDYTSPTMGSLYVNSSTTGRWLDYTADEIVPLIDRTYRTLPHSASRAVIGDFMGGRGALALAMTHPERFGSVYAMHPVATGNGDLPWAAQTIDWAAIHAATSFDDLSQPGLERVFTMICQATLPNPARPPFYCDFVVEPVNGTLTPSPANTLRAQRAFLLDYWLEDHADALRQLRGLAFDWGRNDPTRAHVISNRNFSRLLSDLGIAHKAEEFAGGIWDHTWTDDGRFPTRVLPFLGRHLATAP